MVIAIFAATPLNLKSVVGATAIYQDTGKLTM